MTSPLFAGAALAACLGVGPLAACDKQAARLDLSRYVTIDPGASIVNMPGDEATLSVAVRNVAPVELRELALAVQSPGCTARVAPARVPRLIPGDRTRFSVTLTRRGDSRRTRETLALTLAADGLPATAGVDLIVDQQPAADRGWIDVGQVKLVRRPGGRSAYFLLAGLPMLLIAGWLLYRLSRRRLAGAKAGGDER